MLVLTRSKEKTIVIDGNIEITVVEIKDHQVKFSINAPKNVTINRKEIQELIDKKEDLHDA